MTRTVNHEVVTDSGTVHVAADSQFRPAHILGCTGRAIHGAGAAFGLTTGVTCRACIAGERSGRIVRS